MLVPPDRTDAPFPLLITGLPGSGKSHFGRALGHLGWTFLEGDNAGAWPDTVHEAWDLALAGDDDSLREEAHRNPGGLVIEWGFPASHLETIKSLMERGYECWYFDGDREAALEAWLGVDQARRADWFNGEVDALEARAA
jgi:hypothetical protein